MRSRWILTGLFGLLAGAVAGCDSTVIEGSVNGYSFDDVEIQSVIWDEIEVTDVTGDMELADISGTVIAMAVADVPDLCARISAGEMGEIDQATGFGLVLHYDQRSPFGEYSVMAFDYTDEASLIASALEFVGTEHSALSFFGRGESTEGPDGEQVVVEDSVVLETGVSGTVQIEGHGRTAESPLQGTFRVEYTSGDRLAGRFDAVRCADMLSGLIDENMGGG